MPSCDRVCIGGGIWRASRSKRLSRNGASGFERLEVREGLLGVPAVFAQTLHGKRICQASLGGQLERENVLLLVLGHHPSAIEAIWASRLPLTSPCAGAMPLRWSGSASMAGNGTVLGTGALA